MSGHSTEHVRGLATDAHAGRPCPYCRFALKESVEIVQCGACGSVHHADCWDDNGGCSIMACPGGPGETPATHSAPAPAVAAQVAAPPPAPVISVATQSVPVAAAAPPASTPPAPSGGSKRGGALLIGAIVLLAFAISGVAVALVLTKSKTPAKTVSARTTGAAAGGADHAPAPTPTETLTPEPTGTPDPAPTEAPVADSTGVLPDVSRAQMRRDIRDMLLTWHEDIADGDSQGAWDLLTERKRQQAERKFGFSKWSSDQETLGRYLDPSGIRASIQDIDEKTGVARVMVAGMIYDKPGAYCEWRGVTWVRYEDGEWKYDPGYSTTPQREREWKNRFSELLGGAC
jgi:uncharacterized membrane protein